MNKRRKKFLYKLLTKVLDRKPFRAFMRGSITVQHNEFRTFKKQCRGQYQQLDLINKYDVNV